MKLFSNQNLRRAVDFKCERADLNFFKWCQAHSRHGETDDDGSSDDEDDDSPACQVVPIRLDAIRPQEAPQQLADVDTSGNPTTNIPIPPITEFSWRTFFTTINHLRILQKIIKAKPHRQLMMVQYKYSNVLKRALSVPQPDVRLYTLKIIKGQVPYCHRKWRQSNMGVITAIYLHCHPSLRDEWLVGVDVDQELGEALPAEQALRALTYWHNLRRYPQEMGLAKERAGGGGGAAVTITGESRRGTVMLPEERDFFATELERMDIRVGGGIDGESVVDEGEEMQGPDVQRWST